MFSQGGEIYRGGTRTSARGKVTGSASEKALGSMLDTSVAELASHATTQKASSKAKAKSQAKAKANTKLSSPEEKAKKDLLKDIKAFFSSTMIFRVFGLCDDWSTYVCVCVTHLYRCKTSITCYIFIYMRGITGVPGGSVINEDTSPGPVQTYPRDCGDAPGRI